MPKIHLDAAPAVMGTRYPPPFDLECAQRIKQRLGDAVGLTQFGVNLLRLAPGVWSSQRHWHTHEDEFIYVLEGEVVLITDAGEETLTAGDCAGFKAGVPDGHHIVNRSDREAVLLEVGTRNPGGDGADYPDIDLTIKAGQAAYLHKDGTPYDSSKGRLR